MRYVALSIIDEDHYGPPQEALGMRKGAIAAFAALAMVAAAGQAPPAANPGIPVTGGTVAVADVPVFLNAIGTVQASNMVTIKSRVDGQIVKVAFSEGQDAKAGTPL